MQCFVQHGNINFNDQYDMQIVLSDNEWLAIPRNGLFVWLKYMKYNNQCMVPNRLS